MVVLHAKNLVCSIRQGGDGEHQCPDEEQYPDCLHEAWVVGWGFVEDHLTHEVDCVGDRVVGVEPVEECWLGFWWVQGGLTPEWWTP